jgi:hypothetical protein
VATFDDAVPQIGGGYTICGYGSQQFTQILRNDDKICVRSKLSIDELVLAVNHALSGCREYVVVLTIAAPFAR